MFLHFQTSDDRTKSEYTIWIALGGSENISLIYTRQALQSTQFALSVFLQQQLR